MKIFLFFLLVPTLAMAADNQIIIDQVGDNNTFTVYQDSANHTASITLGKNSAVDNTSVTVEQRDSGTKSATVEINSGYNNTISIVQQGTGNHTASLLNLNGAANNITIQQSGPGSHSFTASAAPGTVNSGNSISASQSGPDKTFNLNLNGTSGASITVQQTNPLTTDSGSMSVQCLPGSCGTFSYIRQ